MNIKKYIWNGIYLALLATLLFVPSAKALLIEGLMQVGLFQPTLKETPASLKNTVDIKFKNEKGETVTLDSFKGKVVFINFWASWCPPCVAEMPSIQKLYNRYKNNPEVAFIMVDADAKLERSRKFLDKKKYDFPVYQMASGVSDQLFTGTLPTTVVLDKMGRFSYKGEGAANYNSKKFVAFMDKLLQLKN